MVDVIDLTSDVSDDEIARPPLPRKHNTNTAGATFDSRAKPAHSEAARQERIKGFEKFHEARALQRRIEPRNATTQQSQHVPNVKSSEWKKSTLSKFSSLPTKPALGPTTPSTIHSKRPASDVENTPPTQGTKRARTDAGQPFNALVAQSERSNSAARLKLLVKASGPSRSGHPWTIEEDELLRELREEHAVMWKDISKYFNGRTKESLQTRYSTKFGGKGKRASEPVTTGEECDVSTTQTRSKRQRKSTVAVGFVSWSSLNGKAAGDDLLESPKHDNAEPNLHTGDALSQQDGTYPSSLSRNLRYREMGLTSRRAWTGTRTVTAEMKNHTFQDYTIQRQYHGTSGDIVALSWSPDGSRFAAGSIAISDSASMQYNMPRNLLLGNKDELLELADHYVPRPAIEEESNNVNALHAMRESQDPRLFTTVSSTGFSPDGSILLTTGADRMLRQYNKVDRSLERVTHPFAVEHSESVDLLAIHPHYNWAATGCHSASKSLCVFAYSSNENPQYVYYPGRNETSPHSYPSALRWGVAPQHHKLLLAGFAGNSAEVGETRLWDVEAQKRIELHAATGGVFDVAWNPRPSATSTSFIVASSSRGHVDRGTRSVIQCFAPDQGRGGAHRILTWECQAQDINDVLMCPYDENLVAAGATDGRVYIWDHRYISSMRSLHTFKHGMTENVIDHSQPREEADTGVRFLSWGATKDRLYSGSSDGVIKVWNPYRSPGNAFINDITSSTRKTSAIMSGIFSPDYRELLVGKENGLIELFEAGGQAIYKALDFKLRPAPSLHEDAHERTYAASHALLESGQIELRSCGAMPFRQAVQGPFYSGPYAEPLPEEFAQAHTEADRVTARLADLENRKQHFKTSEPRALAFQQSLLQGEDARKALVARLSHTPEPCMLDCAVLRGSEEEEVDDSNRSALRIPDTLRSVAENAIAARDPTEKRVSCFACCPERKNVGKTCPQCASKAALQRLGLVAACVVCAGPARIATEEEEQTMPIVCEKCCFACFRCGKPALLSPAMTRVTCSPCGYTWRVGALGYELSTPLTFRPKKARQVVSPADEDWNAFGEGEREHYAGQSVTFGP